MKTLLLPSLRFLLLPVCALLAASAPLHAVTQTHFVTTGGDDFQNPQPGSLRHALEVLAQPGDTIKFPSPIVVTLVDNLLIESGLDGLRIEGPGQIVYRKIGNFVRAVLSIEANDVTLANLQFKNVYLSAEGFDGGSQLAGPTVQGCEFSTRGAISLTFTQGSQLLLNKFFLTDNVPDESVILLRETEDTVVANNTIESRGTPGLTAQGAENLDVRDNTSDASFEITLFAGRVTNNSVLRRVITVYQAQQNGPIVVEDNQCSALIVTGVDLSVRRNTVRGDRLRKKKAGLPVHIIVDEDATPQTALGVHVGLVSGQAPYDGPIVVEDNIITGGITGLAFTQRTATPQTNVLNNEVRKATLKGMALSVTVPAIIAGNTIENCTGETRGPQAALAINEGTEDLLIESNTLLGNQCVSIVISTGATATVKNNTIKGGARAGIMLNESAEIVAENNTIETCKGSGLLLKPNAAALLTGGTIRKIDGPGIVVSQDALLDAANVTVEKNAGHGVLFKKQSSGVIEGGHIRRNDGAGVFLIGGAQAELDGVSFSANRDPGIDIAPAGVSPNRQTKTANGDIDFPAELEFNTVSRKIMGEAEPGAVIQLFRSEPGARTGKLRNGEGATFLGETVVDGNGMFAISPGSAQEGDLFCFTATRPGAQPVTSEFSENIKVPPSPPIERVTVSSDEVESNGASIENTYQLNLSDNGRFVVFGSSATNLVPNDTNEGLDIFLRDITNGTTSRVSVNSAGQQAEGAPLQPVSSSSPSMSADGLWIAFRSTATNLVPGLDGNPNFSSGFIAIHNRETGQTTGVTDPLFFDDTRPFQSQRRGQGTDPSISADGNVVAFISQDGAFLPVDANDDILDDTNAGNDIFVWTRTTGEYERVSLTTTGQQLPGSVSYQQPRLSGDGERVVFASAGVLDPANDVAGFKIFLRDRATQTTQLISRGAGEAGLAVTAHSPTISRDGVFVAFVTPAALVAADTNGTDDVYLRRISDGTVELCSRKPDGGQFIGDAKTPALSADARYVAFSAPGQSDDDGFIQLHDDLFVLDRQTGTVLEAGIGIAGEALGQCTVPSLSGDGRFMTFKSPAENLVENDTNFLEDLFIRDRAAELEEP